MCCWWLYCILFFCHLLCQHIAFTAFAQHRKNHKLRKERVLHKPSTKRAKVVEFDDDVERNITILYDHVGKFNYDHNSKSRRMRKPTIRRQHQNISLNHKTPTTFIRKRPVNTMGAKRTLHSYVHPSSFMFASTKPLGIYLGPADSASNVNEMGTSKHPDEVPVGPVSQLVSGEGLKLPIDSIPFRDSEGDTTSNIVPHQTTFVTETKHLYQHGAEKYQGGLKYGGYLQPRPVQMMAPPVHGRSEEISNSVVPHQTTFDSPPKHIYQEGVERTQGGFVSGGFLQKHPISMRVPGFHHIIRKPIHVEDPHATTSYETSIEEGTVHEHPCLNGGIYFSMAGQYQCICPEQFIGRNCQGKNYCHPCPCQNNGICHNTEDDPFYKCHCKIGWYGLECDKKDPCYPNPCKNLGMCTHDGQTASCICTKKFRGKHCDSLNNCNPDPCKNGGTCIELKGEGKFQCDCLPMYRGTLCRNINMSIQFDEIFSFNWKKNCTNKCFNTTSINFRDCPTDLERSYCYINPCRNGGTCREGEDRFVCDCPKGFSGPACADRVCQPNPCMNGGTCIEDDEKFKCVCLPWTTGNLCEETRPCLTKPCMHDGRCIDSYSGFHWSFGPLQYYCVCKRPYKGMNCENHACQNCHKNAHCDTDHCVCDEGYEGNGETCRKVDSPCYPNPCMNKGICTEVADFCSGHICGFKCACPDPYLPPLCKNKNPCDPDPCVNGVCVPHVDGTSTCQCDPGFRGPSCADKDACHPNPCQHHGACKDFNGTASCSCPGEWKPPYCKECGCPYRSIDGSPTQFCSPEGACLCPSGYTPNPRQGTCTKQEIGAAERRPCHSNPCENGGTCMDISDVEFSCICQKGFSGKVCQHKPVCNPGPCLNGGTCKEEDGKFMGCDCPPHYSPPLCKKPSPLNAPCEPNPCLQGGVCIANRGAYDCICPTRFTGPHCDVDKCAHCDMHARCVNGRCKCMLGYVGNGYSCERETCEATCVEWSTCIDGQCVCNPGYAYVYNKCVPRPIMPGELPEEEEIRPIYPTGGTKEGSGPGIISPTFVPQTTPTSRPNIVLPKKGGEEGQRIRITTPQPIHKTDATKLPEVLKQKEKPPTKTKDKDAGPPGSKTTDADVSSGPPGSRRSILLDDQDEDDNSFAGPPEDN